MSKALQSARRLPRQALLIVTIVLAGALVALAVPGAADQHRQPSEEDVTGAVQVTSNPTPTRGHSSPQIAVNPTNGELVVVETNVMALAPGRDYGCNVHLSIDEGRSWAPGGDPMMEPWTECSRVTINGHYQTVEFASDGTLYLAFAASDPQFSNPHPNNVIPRHIFLARSDDGGRTFETTHVHAADPDEPPEDPHDFPASSGNERPMVAVDPNDPDRVYIGWQQNGERDDEKRPGVVAASTDGGESFSDPVDLTDDRGGSQPRLAVDGDGTVHAVYGAMTFGLPEDEDHDNPLVYRRSTDGGETWSEPADVDPGVGNNRKWVITADPNSENLYVSWDGNPEVGGVGEDDYRDVYVRTSRDGGNTWGEPVAVHADPQSADGVKRYHPGIDVAPNGRLDVVWYDFRNSPVPEGVAEGHDGYFHAGGLQDVYYSSMGPDDDGFGVDVRVTDRIIDRNIGVWSNNTHSYTNIGIASTDNRVYMVWQDSREGDAETDAEDVYFASVRLDDWQQQPVGAVDGGAATSGSGLWALLITVFLLGMGMAMLLAVPIRRRFGART